MCCTSLTSAAVLFIESHKGICTTAHTTLKAKVLSFFSYAAHCNCAYIHQQTIALVHQASTYTVSLWWVVQLHQAFLLGGKNMGREYNYYRQKRLCRATEGRRGLSATRIHSTVGRSTDIPDMCMHCYRNHWVLSYSWSFIFIWVIWVLLVASKLFKLLHIMCVSCYCKHNRTDIFKYTLFLD